MIPSQPRARRPRVTRRGVLVAERFARFAITLGGIGTIVAVSLIFVFLAWVVVPLFGGASVGEQSSFDSAGAVPAAMGVDEERLLAWTLRAGGRLEVNELRTGELLDAADPFAGGAPTAISLALESKTLLLAEEDEAEEEQEEPPPNVVFGFADGSLRVGRIGFVAEFLHAEGQLPEELRSLARGANTVFRGGVVERTNVGQLKLTRFALELEDPIEPEETSAVVAIDHASTPLGLYVCTLQADGRLAVSRVKKTKNLLTGKVTVKRKSTELPLEDALGEGRELPSRVGIAGLGQHVFLIWDDGRMAHVDVREFDAPRVQDVLDLVPEEDFEVSATAFMNGERTLVVGDTSGRVRAWFLTREDPDDEQIRLTLARALGRSRSPVVALAPSPRSRLLAAAHQDGLVELFQVTTGYKLLETRVGEPPSILLVPAKDDAIVALGPERVSITEVEPAYPEASLKSLFTPVWYEGYPRAEHVWQSSSGTDDFEPKLGLVPLVFGTLKATLYSLLFGAPIALLAAIYTSEFMHRRLRASVKSTVELMASLPSVVLGFLAALVIAPFVQDVLPAVLVALVSVPFTVLLGAHLWQLLPQRMAVRLSGWQRFLAIALTIPVGAAAGAALGGPLEGVLFAGDVQAWLDGRVGSAFGGWLYLFLPAGALAAALLFGAVVNPRLQSAVDGLTRGALGRLAIAKFLGGTLVALALASLAAALLAVAGLDPRGSVFDTYVQRNALIVGFAIIPIIYTLAEDALSEVPSQLREGSLGAGATHWQTATRIVIPFAMSGLFSAMMIGLGRAVGETMIVLMAAGNTPIMEWNVFNGFRTLSANIAVELPEAVRGSAHYRTLFLAALVLFALTFVLNTLAELVRRHFRRRTHAL